MSQANLQTQSAIKVYFMNISLVHAQSYEFAECQPVCVWLHTDINTSNGC